MSLEGEGAGAGQDDGQGESGASSGGSSKGGSENDDKPITAKQLKAALENQKRHYEVQLAGQRSEFEAFKEGVGKKDKPADQPKVYAKAELKAAVEAGQISQEQADDLWDRQRETQIREAAKSDALSAVTGKQTKERVDADIAKYRQLKPEIMQAGSAERDRISEEFRYLVANGSPNNLATELAAIRAALGSLEKLEKAASAKRAADHDQQGGEGGDGKPKGGNSSKKLVDHLKGDAKEFYERGIKQGRYPKGWDDVEAELKFASPNVRVRLGLPA